jgi:hypothetical protein
MKSRWAEIVVVGAIFGAAVWGVLAAVVWLLEGSAV